MSDALTLDGAPVRLRARDFLDLSKSRIVLMVVLTTAAGFAFGAGKIDPLLMFHTLLGTAMVASGTNALNQLVERNQDARMHRTRRRPLPSGRMSTRTAWIFSTGIAAAGTLYLLLAVNGLTALLGILTLTSYIFVYTPLKRISTICTLVGAAPGAIPPLMGWTAATGSLAPGGWILFGILFFWQLPHFMAISWIYREDYARGGFAMLSVRDTDGSAVARSAVMYTLFLMAVSVLPWVFGLAGVLYLAGTCVATVLLLACAVRFFFERSRTHARQLFLVSNLYLLTVMLLLVADARL